MTPCHEPSWKPFFEWHLLLTKTCHFYTASEDFVPFTINLLVLWVFSLLVFKYQKRKSFRREQIETLNKNAYTTEEMRERDEDGEIYVEEEITSDGAVMRQIMMRWQNDKTDDRCLKMYPVKSV